MCVYENTRCGQYVQYKNVRLNVHFSHFSKLIYCYDVCSIILVYRVRFFPRVGDEATVYAAAARCYVFSLVSYFAPLGWVVSFFMVLFYRPESGVHDAVSFLWIRYFDVERGDFFVDRARTYVIPETWRPRHTHLEPLATRTSPRPRNIIRHFIVVASCIHGLCTSSRQVR